jgi:hypothetical protein
MTSGIMEGRPLFRDIESISLPVANLVDLAAESMADLLFEGLVDSRGGFRGFPGLLAVRKAFPSHECADSHQGPEEGAACLTVPGNASGEDASRLKNVVTDRPGFFLQSCKNGLRSAVVIHFIGKGCLVGLFKQSLAVFASHRSFPCYGNLIEV